MSMYQPEQLSVVLWVLVLATAVCDDCLYKECLCFDIDINCPERGLTTFPQRVVGARTNYDELDLDFNMITRIPSGSLPTSLKQLSMMNNPLIAVDDSAFDDSANTLTTLSFSNAAFTKLPDAFLRLKKLMILQISNSNISDWNVDAMNNVGLTLEIFYGDNCGLPAWPDWVKNLSHLTQLTLSNNYISSVPDNALGNLTNSLAILSLANNNLTSVPKALLNLSELQYLYLQGNKITSVSFLPHASPLLTLSLSTNNIFDTDQLNKVLQTYANSLSSLDIDSNHLPSVPNLSSLTHLQSLSLLNNRISDPTTGSLPPELSALRLDQNLLSVIPRILFDAKSVTDMFLISNVIREIRSGDLPPWTVGVELGYNLITELTDSSFAENSSIQFLHLYNNPIVRISNYAFKNLPRLNELDIRYSKLTRLPLGLATAANLRYIDFTGSTNLICTCLEKDLKPWIVSLNPGGLTGDCGLTSIYTFFATLIEYCPA